MERDPARLAWKAAPARHLAAGLLLLAAGILLLVELELVRAAIDRAAGASARADVPFLQLAVEWPSALGLPPLVLFPGMRIGRDGFLAVLAAIVGIPVLIAALLVGVDRIAMRVGSIVLGRVRSSLLQNLVAAPPSRRETAANAAGIAADLLPLESRSLGAAALGRLAAAGLVAVCWVFALTADWRLAAALMVTLPLAGAAHVPGLGGQTRLERARAAEAAAIERGINELMHRFAALRAHGTGPLESERLDQLLAERHRTTVGHARKSAMAGATAAVAMLLPPLIVFALSVQLALNASLGLGSAVAVTLAAGLASLGVHQMVTQRHALDRLRPVLAEAARALALLQSREAKAGDAALPGTGALVAQGVWVQDPASGTRLTGIDLAIAFPAHVALVGSAEAGPRLLASLLGGQVDPSGGRLTFGGVDLARTDPVERSRRIGYAGGDTILVRGSLRENLLYGCPDDVRDLDLRLSEAIAVAGLDGLVHSRGLAGTLDPQREPKLAAAIVETRRIVRAELSKDGLDDAVEAFDAGRYNTHATIGENLMFGRPIGDTFREDNLASHPFVRAILDAQDLTKPLVRVGRSVAASMVEIFADVPDRHPLFERYSFYAASDRTYFEELVGRPADEPRGSEWARDRERLIGLALRYNESRHRLGLLDADVQSRVLAARAAFARMLPMSLQPSIEFYDETRLCSPASVLDNLLFGRIATDRAGAEAAVHGLIRRVLTERGLDAEIMRVGLDAQVDARTAAFATHEIAAIDLVRCLARRPDVLVVERALDGLSASGAESLVARLRRAMVGRGLVVVTSGLAAGMDRPPFDAVIRIERGTARVEDRRAFMQERVSA